MGVAYLARGWGCAKIKGAAPWGVGRNEGQIWAWARVLLNSASLHCQAVLGRESAMLWRLGGLGAVVGCCWADLSGDGVGVLGAISQPELWASREDVVSVRLSCQTSLNLDLEPLPAGHQMPEWACKQSKKWVLYMRPWVKKEEMGSPCVMVQSEY